jgi:tetratricopeptide (TPR) repeat protein
MKRTLLLLSAFGFAFNLHAQDLSKAQAHYQLAMQKKASGDKNGTCAELGNAIHYNDTMKAAKNAFENNFCWSCGMEFYKKGKINVNVKQYKDALSDLTMAVTICCDSGNYWGYLGKDYEGLGKTDSAFMCYAAGIKIDSSNAYYSYYFRGLAYQKEQKYDQAFQDFSKAIQLQPSVIDPYIHRATVSDSMGKESSALYDYNQILKLKPDYGMAYFKIALHKIKMGGKIPCDDFQKALDNGVDEAQPYVDACNKEKNRIRK